MFTTEMPDAHDVSIPRSAANPSNDAPYPIDVGTATTGTSTSPPTTLASAPSMPAITMTTDALSNIARLWRSRWIPATPTS